MRPIHPINAEQCRPHYGKPVCVIMKDETEFIGTLSRLENGKLILNEDTETAANRPRAKTTRIRTKKRKTVSKNSKSGQQAANILASAPSPAFGGTVALDLPTVGLLFVLD